MKLLLLKGNDMGTPVISIVIVNYNYGRFLETAIKSVVEQQSFDQCELIIVDGGSSDESVEIIKKYQDRIAWWVSEKDKGQSDAFNKGFAHARGRLGCWLNADDLILPGTLAAVLRQMEMHPETEWVTGGTIFFDSQMKIWKARIGTGITKCMHKWVDATVIGGPSSFFSIKRLHDVGDFNLKLHYIMDGDLWDRFFAAGLRMVHLNRYFWGFRVHEMSKTAHALKAEKSNQFKEEERLKSNLRWKNRPDSVRVKRLKWFKILNGSLLRSYIDTKRFAGREIWAVS